MCLCESVSLCCCVVLLCWVYILRFFTSPLIVHVSLFLLYVCCFSVKVLSYFPFMYVFHFFHFHTFVCVCLFSRVCVVHVCVCVLVSLNSKVILNFYQLFVYLTFLFVSLSNPTPETT